MIPQTEGIRRTAEYLMVSHFYGTRTTKRSGALLMNHIDEGLYIMARYGNSISAQRAFCIHPLLQRDEDLAKNWYNVTCNIDRTTVLLAMEYRNIANQYLSHRTIGDLSEIALSPLGDVNDMLIADKIQNYKDFRLYHRDTHPRSAELTEYFRNWLKRLEVDPRAYEDMIHDLQQD